MNTPGPLYLNEIKCRWKIFKIVSTKHNKPLFLNSIISCSIYTVLGVGSLEIFKVSGRMHTGHMRILHYFISVLLYSWLHEFWHEKLCTKINFPWILTNLRLEAHFTRWNTVLETCRTTVSIITTELYPYFLM